MTEMLDENLLRRILLHMRESTRSVHSLGFLSRAFPVVLSF